MKGEFIIEDMINELNQLFIRLGACGNYDIEKYLYSQIHTVNQLIYFFGTLAKGKNPDKIIYRISKKPRVHQMAYFNIGRGFPKELMDGHWCYILKDLGVKAVVIPCTSIKYDSNTINPLYEKDITILDGLEFRESRLQLSEIRTIDYQRVDPRKTYCNVVTTRKEIMQFARENMFE